MFVSGQVMARVIPGRQLLVVTAVLVALLLGGAVMLVRSGDVVAMVTTVSSPTSDGGTAAVGGAEEVTPSPEAPASPSPASPFSEPAALTSPLPSPSPTGAPSVLTDNQAPVADAGSDQVVHEGALVVLDGTASLDPDGEVLTYRWEQLSGPVVELLSDRTATPSLTAGGRGETYIFSLTVRDPRGATATEAVTVATRAVGPALVTPVVTTALAPTPPVGPAGGPSGEAPLLVRRGLHPLNLLLFFLAVASAAQLLGERAVRSLHERAAQQGAAALLRPERVQPSGRVIHHQTGEGIAGVQVLVYGADGKLRQQLRTNDQGQFETFFPVGQYTVSVAVEGYTMAASAPRALAASGTIIYTGGMLTVRDPNAAVPLIIPLKPAATDVSVLRTWRLRTVQALQYAGRMLSWPVFLLGALLNTILVFWVPRPLYLGLELLYIVLVIVKIALEIKVRPAYGLVRDAITHVPLDLAVVRLFEAATNRLVMTRETNNQGKFFALPPPGTYTVTIAKAGYGAFAKQNVRIALAADAAVQLTADLMPLAPPVGSLRQAQAAIA